LQTLHIAVIGLGKLGSPLAAVIAAKGHTVVGADLNPVVVQLINAGQPPVDEPGLGELLAQAQGRLTATQVVAEAVGAADISFIVVPTPSQEDGSFLNDMVVDAVTAVGTARRSQPGRHVVVVTSTVMPGSSAGPIRAALEQASGMVVGADIGLCYSPEFIALGSVIHDILNADLVLIGESDPTSGQVLEEVLSGLVERDAPVMRMNLVNAEVAKLAINTFVTTKISYANMLAEICEQLPGADAGVVSAAVGLDSRIGNKYLQPAIPFGGPCFPRDNRALSRLADSAGVSADIADATQAINIRQVARLAAALTEGLEPRARVAILGLAYKPGTSVAEASAGVDLARRLSDGGYQVAVYDPEAIDATRRILGERVEYADTAAKAIRGAGAIAITTAWDEFRRLDPGLLGPAAKKPLILDCWRLLGDNAFDELAAIVHPGTGARVYD
jgi:UDPglucose 6-dehydrogenase